MASKKDLTKTTTAPVATNRAIRGKSETYKFTITITSGSVMDRERHSRVLGNILTKFCKLSLNNAVVRYNGKVVPFVDLDHEIGISGE